MPIMEAIAARRSVRAYTGEPLRQADAAAVKAFIAETRPPFGVEARIEFVHAELGSEPRRLGSYGTVRGARDFMGLIHADGHLAAEGAAYWFERVVLHCTSLGLGTCWLAGFTQSSFLDAVALAPGESVRYASPVGYPGGKKPVMERLGLVNSDKLHKSKKPFEALFLHPDFTTGLTRDEAGPWAAPLEMARLAPSARNAQPYGVILDDAGCHFHVRPDRFAPADIGIALCHFELACAELGLPGHYQELDAPATHEGWDYTISWVE